MERKIIADLHNHSIASDGDYTAYELITTDAVVQFPQNVSKL